MTAVVAQFVDRRHRYGVSPDGKLSCIDCGFVRSRWGGDVVAVEWAKERRTEPCDGKTTPFEDLAYRICDDMAAKTGAQTTAAACNRHRNYWDFSKNCWVCYECKAETTTAELMAPVARAAGINTDAMRQVPHIDCRSVVEPTQKGIDMNTLHVHLHSWSESSHANMFRRMLDAQSERDAKAQKIERTVEMIERSGMIEGEHHKQWLLDQVLRSLLGLKYQDWLDKYNADDEYSNWDTGIAP